MDSPGFGDRFAELGHHKDHGGKKIPHEREESCLDPHFFSFTGGATGAGSRWTVTFTGRRGASPSAR